MPGQQKYKPMAKRYRTGIIAVSSLMVVLYLTISTVYTASVLRRHHLERESVALENMLESLGVLFESTEAYSKAVLSDETIQDILRYPGFDRNIDIINMRRHLSRYMVSNRHLDAIIIYANDERTYDSGGVVMNPAEWEQAFTTSKKAWVSRREAPYVQAERSYRRPRYVFSLIRPIFSYHDVSKVGIIEIFIHDETITSTFLSHGNGRLFYLVDTDNVIIAHPERSLLQTEDTVPLLDTGILHESPENYIMGVRDPNTGWSLKSVTPTSVVYEPIYRMLLVTSATGLLIIILGILISNKAASAITTGVSKLTEEVRKIDGLDKRVPQLNTRDETAILSDEFNAVLNELEIASSQLVQEQQQKRQFQLELLQQQINPHFLYNTLENISSLAELGYSAELIELVDSIARFYRGVLSKGDVFVPLGKELDIAKSYLEVLKIRSHLNFDYEFDTPPELVDNVCIKLILQPILENSIYHGFHGNQGVRGHIKVEVKEESDSIVINVKDNGKGISPEKIKDIFTDRREESKESIHYGLANIRQRIALYFGPEYGIEVISSEQTGTSVLLRLPRQEWMDGGISEDDKDIIG